MAKQSKKKKAILAAEEAAKKPAKAKKPKASFSWRNPIIIALLAMLTWAVYSNSIDNDFTNWDDPTYVTENAGIQDLSWETIMRFLDFDTYVSGNYHPLTMISLTIDYHFAKLDASFYHKHNLFLHILSTILVFLWITLLCGRWEAGVFVAVVFGIHPMHVESVAWIAERKDLLYGLFYNAALLTYLLYLKYKGAGSYIFYAATALLFVLSVLAKAPAVTLPIVLILIDLYKRRPFNIRLVLEKIPLLAIAVATGLLAIKAQQTADAIQSIEHYNFFQRIFFASYGTLVYVGKFFLPFKLSCFYPYPDLVETRLPWIFYAALPGALVLLAFVVYSGLKRHSILFGFGFFLVTVALVLQILPVGSALMADRYTYLPYIGLAYLIVQPYFMIEKLPLAKAKNFRSIMIATFLFFTIYMGYITHERNKVWENSLTLWTDCIEKYPNVPVAYNNRGNYWSRKQNPDYDKAFKDYERCIKVNPDYYNVYVNRGNIYGIRGQHQLAINDYSRALSLEPGNMEAMLNQAISYANLKQYEKAVNGFNEALAVNPNSLQGYSMRGFAYYEWGKYDKALQDYNIYISKKPDDFNSYFYRGLVNYKLRNMDQALSDYNLCLSLNPRYANAYMNRSIILNEMGRNKEALSDAQMAKQLGFQVNETFMERLKQAGG